MRANARNYVLAAVSAAAASVHTHHGGAHVTARAAHLHSAWIYVAGGSIRVASHVSVCIAGQIAQRRFVFTVAGIQTTCLLKISQCVIDPSFIIICAAN